MRLANGSSGKQSVSWLHKRGAMNNVPQLCFGSVRHKRLKPVVNEFEYGVYFLRLPLRSMANTPSTTSTTSTTRLFSRNRWNLLSFHDKDHGDGQQALVSWIEQLLAREGIKDADGEIWLQTFPRVLGYVFNPVSFWFCHQADSTLRAVLCEVNNTFGERHCYLLDTGGPIANGAELSARKLFHVSPFCAIEGGYRFRFVHSQRQVGEGSIERFSAHINHDDATGPLLQTGISGIASPVSDAVVAKAFFSFPLMTAMVVARIHWQALRLWLKRVPFFSKPLPPANELSR